MAARNPKDSKMSRAMSRNTMRCLEIAFLVTLLNLLLSFTVVQWYSADSSSQDASLSQDSRLLLSVEYQDSPHTNPLSTPSASSEATAPAHIKSSPDVRPAKIGDDMTWRTSYSYPQNLLRNLAKAGCQTNYTYIPDIDMVPTPGMDLRLETFLAKDQELGNCTKCAFVIPTYEISTEAGRLPANKTELVSYIRDKKARQFHQAVYSINQKSSDLKRWEKIPETDTIDTAYKVEKYIFKYEPLYVARGDTPPFDERFIGFGMTRNTQVYEMYVAGYSFHLLNNAFTSHWGFQSYSTRPVWRAKQMEENNGKFDEFAKELSAHYNADPYDMLSKLKKMNLKHVKVASKITKTSGNDKTKDKS